MGGLDGPAEKYVEAEQLQEVARLFGCFPYPVSTVEFWRGADVRRGGSSPFQVTRIPLPTGTGR